MNGMILLQILVSLALGGAVFLLIVSIFRTPVRATSQRRASGSGTQDNLFEQPALAPVMALLLDMAEHCQWTSLRQRIHRDLNASGNPSGYSIDQYIALCMGMAILFVVGVVIFEFLLEGSQLMIWGPLALIGGFWLPLMALRSEADKRLLKIRKQLPYTLDLIALTMAAGSSFSEAVMALIRDLPDDPLNEELAMAMREIEFGTTRAQALLNMAERVPLESLRSIVGAVNQAERLGSSMSVILKLQSEMLRQQRSIRAEKLAASASLRILIPSMLIMIAVVMVVFAPMVMVYIQRGTLW